jgi:hypothetical protein
MPVDFLPDGSGSGRYLQARYGIATSSGEPTVIVWRHG